MRVLRRPLSIALLIPLLLGACANTASSAGDGSSRPDRELLTQEQLRRHRTVYEAVEALRSNWLRPRGTGSFNNPPRVQVYMDGNRAGGVEVLRSLSPSGVSYVRYYDGIAASSRWGLGHESGVIFVSSLSD